MRSDKELIALHERMRKVAFERLSEPLVKALEEKKAGSNDARTA